MGLEDRDWYREEPSRAWVELRRGAGVAGTATNNPHTPGPGALGRSAFRVTVASLAAFGVISAVVLVGAQPWDRGPAAADPLPVMGGAEREVVLRPTPAMATRVEVPTPWTLSDSRFGTIHVVVPAGEAPLIAIANALLARGFVPTIIDTAPGSRA